jgi:hypothetical protein
VEIIDEAGDRIPDLAVSFDFEGELRQVATDSKGRARAGDTRRDEARPRGPQPGGQAME